MENGNSFEAVVLAPGRVQIVPALRSPHTAPLAIFNHAGDRSKAFRDGIPPLAAVMAAGPDLLDALREAVKVAKEAREAWDADRDARVGKLLIALSGQLPGYREDTDRIAALLRRLEAFAHVD